MVNWLITGGTGFVGHHLVSRLLANQNDNVTVMDVAPKPEWLASTQYKWQPVSDMSVKDLENIDVVVHLAAITDVPFAMNSARYTFTVNLNDTVNLLEIVRRMNKQPKIVLMSSESSYGLVPPERLPIREEEPLFPVNPYAASKAAEDITAQAYIRGFNLPIVIVRASTMIGEYARAKMVASIFINQALRGQDLTIEGDGSQSKDLNYVGNTVNGIIKSAISPNVTGVYNLGSGTETTILSLCQTVLKLTESDSSIIFKPWRAGEKGIRTALSIEKAKRDFEYEPSVSFEEGLTRHINYLRGK